MKTSIPAAVLLGSFLLMASCQGKPNTTTEVSREPYFKSGQEYYRKHIELAIIYLDSLSALKAEDPLAKEFFIKTREAFKIAEPYASYLNPAVGHRANGPALPVFKEDTGKVLLPLGLQKLEESIYEGGVSDLVFKREIAITKGLLHNLKEYIIENDLNAQRFFIATHQQLLRIISLGISGFDTPVSQLGLRESAISLRSLKEVYEQTIRQLVQDKDAALDLRFGRQIGQAVTYLEKNEDFEAFDRFIFIRDYMNPITRSWVAIRKTSGIWEGSKNYPFNFDAPTFFEADAFNVGYFSANKFRNPSPARIALGEKLFFEPGLSENGQMACATCHVPEKAYTDGLIVNIDNSGKPLQRNTPTLINSAFQQAFFWDGRSATLRDQISSVFTNEKEFAGNVHQFSAGILKDSSYAALFTEAFGMVPNNNLEVINALSAYIGTLRGFQSKFDRNIRGEEDSFTVEEKLGFNLYMGKALCATCHFIPLTNGTVPPFYHETEKEVIGVPETAENATLDDDTGFYWLFGSYLHKGMFKTPTVRNAAQTAPYMHNGVYGTLDEVIDFYNLGGGRGLGFDLAYQTLPFDELNLTSAEQQALVAFIRTLTDTEISGIEADGIKQGSGDIDLVTAQGL